MRPRPRRHKRTLLRDAAEFGFVLAVEWFFACIGLKASLALARALGRLLHRVWGRYPAIARNNLRNAFPKWSDAEIERVSVRVAEHLAQAVVEGLLFPRLLLGRRQFEQHVRLEVHPEVLERIAAGKPMIFATGHFGNWELAPFVAVHLGVRVASVMRPLDNRFLNRRVVAIRERMRQGLIDRKGALLGMARCLREGISIGVLADQDAKKEGIFVDFFGRPASTVDGIAALALRLDVPIVPGWLLRDPGVGRFTFYLEEPLPLERTGEEARDRRVLTQRMVKRLEEAIRRHPAQWVWFHQRWKTRPPSGYLSADVRTS